MIHIQTHYPDHESIVIRVDGVIDAEGLEVLKEVCQRHLDGRRRVALDLDGLVQANREGVAFLREVVKRARILNSPDFILL
ncbi:MAG: STAS domain-containing protein [Proteobacteria bacterium]|nr:STAS domain-containing protein [Pseudomonadota bacterium]